jgi:hypothetical protein
MTQMAYLLKTFKEIEGESVQKQIEQVNEFLRVQMLKTFENMTPIPLKTEDKILNVMNLGPAEKETMRPMFRATIE